MNRSDRLELLNAMFERQLKRELTPEERRLLALSDLFCESEGEGTDEGDGAARGEFAS